MTNFIEKLFDSKPVQDRPVWMLMGKTYAPPAPMSFIRQNISELSLHPDLMERLVNGATTLVFQEQTTGETRTEVVVGTDEDKIESLARKADVGGMVFFEVGDDTYAITKWVSQDNGKEKK